MSEENRDFRFPAPAPVVEEPKPEPAVQPNPQPDALPGHESVPNPAKKQRRAPAKK